MKRAIFASFSCVLPPLHLADPENSCLGVARHDSIRVMFSCVVVACRTLQDFKNSLCVPTQKTNKIDEETHAGDSNQHTGCFALSRFADPPEPPYVPPVLPGPAPVTGVGELLFCQ